MDNIAEKIGIIYCRVSSKDQVDGTSLESQERLCKEWANNQGIKVSKVFVELGESAKTANRTEFQKALTFCSDKRNKVNYFIVYKLDRFARNQYDHETVRALLQKSKVFLRSVTEAIDETSTGRLMETLLAGFAEYDNNVRKERTTQGMVERVKQGFWVWQAPVGYYRPAKGANIAPKPGEAEYIKIIFEEYSKGTYTYKALAEHSAKLGFRTQQGCSPRSQLIEKILRNPLYCGIMEVWEEQFEGSFEPIISKELFAKCQPGYKSTHAAPRSTNNPLYPLRTFAKCQKCGGSLTGSMAKGKYPYYHHHRQKCEGAKFIPKATFEQLFIQLLNDITPTSKYEKLFKAVVVQIWKNNYRKFDLENARIRKDIAVLEQERQKVFELHREGKYNDDEFLEQKQLVNDRINAKRLLIQDKAAEEMDMEEALSYCFDFVRNTAQTWIKLERNYPARLRFQNKVFASNITFDGKKFGTPELSRIYKLNQEYQGKKSNLVALRGIEPRLPG